MTHVVDVHSRLSETPVAIVVPFDSPESIGTALVRSSVGLHEAA